MPNVAVVQVVLGDPVAHHRAPPRSRSRARLHRDAPVPAQRRAGRPGTCSGPWPCQCVEQGVAGTPYAVRSPARRGAPAATRSRRQTRVRTPGAAPRGALDGPRPGAQRRQHARRRRASRGSRRPRAAGRPSAPGRRRLRARGRPRGRRRPPRPHPGEAVVLVHRVVPPRDALGGAGLASTRARVTPRRGRHVCGPRRRPAYRPRERAPEPRDETEEHLLGLVVEGVAERGSRPRRAGRRPPRGGVAGVCGRRPRGPEPLSDATTRATTSTGSRPRSAAQGRRAGLRDLVGARAGGRGRRRRRRPGRRRVPLPRGRAASASAIESPPPAAGDEHRRPGAGGPARAGGPQTGLRRRPGAGPLTGGSPARRGRA